MATTRWTGAASEVWTTAGNWTNGVPANGDVVIFPKTAAKGVTSATDLSAASRDLGALYIEEGFNYTVGSASAPLICTADLISVVGTQNSTLYYTPSAAAGTNACDLMIVESPNIVNAVTVNNGNKAFTRLDVLQGKVVCAESVAFVNTKQTARFNNIPQISMSSGSATTIITQNGGLITHTAPTDAFLTWILNGGEALCTGAITAITSPGEVTVHILAGLFRNEGSSSGVAVGSAVDFYVHGGTLDMARIDDAWANNVFIWPEGTVYQTPDPIATNHYIGID